MNPGDVFRSFDDNCPLELLASLFSHWPAQVGNPFVLPVCLYSCMQCKESPYNTVEFIRLAQAQIARDHPGIPLLVAAFLLKKYFEFENAAKRLVAAGDDPNSIVQSALLKTFSKKWACFCGSELFDRIDHVTPLMLAVAFGRYDMVYELIKLGATPSLVCFSLTYLEIIPKRPPILRHVVIEAGLLKRQILTSISN